MYNVDVTKEKLRDNLLEILNFIDNNKYIYWQPPIPSFDRTKSEAFDQLFEEITYAEKEEILCIVVNLFFNTKTNLLGDRTSNNIVFPAFMIEKVSTTSSTQLTINLINDMEINSREGKTTIEWSPPDDKVYGIEKFQKKYKQPINPLKIKNKKSEKGNNFDIAIISDGELAKFSKI